MVLTRLCVRFAHAASVTRWARTSRVKPRSERFTRVSMTALAVAMGSLAVAPGQASGWQEWSATFDDCAIPGGTWDEKLQELGTVAVERSSPFTGECAARFRQNAHTSGTKRIELQSDRLSKGAAAVGSEAWYEFRYRPISISPPTGGSRVVHVNQFKNARPCYTGGIDIDPAGAAADRWKLTVVSGPGCGTVTRYDLGEVAFHKWTTINVHYKWSQRSDGFVEAWVNGRRQLAKVSRATTIPKAEKVMLRVGIYSFSHPTTTELLVDDVRVFNRR